MIKSGNQEARRETPTKKWLGHRWASIEAEWEAALLQIPEEILREQIAFWSWPDTPEGQQWIQISSINSMSYASTRKNANSFGQTLSDWILINPSGASINSILVFQKNTIKEFLIFWLRAPYAMLEGYSKSKMAKLERLHNRWVAELEEEEK